MIGLPGPGDALADEAAELVRGRSALRPEVAIVLGSGLGGAMANVHEETSFSFDELPGFPRPTVAGHAGALVLGELERAGGGLPRPDPLLRR